MAELKQLRDTALATVIDDDAVLGNGARAAADYDNSAELDFSGVFYLTVQWNTTAPSANIAVAELYVLPGDGEGTEVFPEGGDAGLGTDDDPQACFLVHTFETINPSITVDETIGSPEVELYGDGNRVVLKNISGQEFDLTWILKLKPAKTQSV